MDFVNATLQSIARRTLEARDPLALLRLIAERRRAATGSEPHARCARLKLAVLSAYTLQPLVAFLEQQLFALGHCVDLHLGDHDRYMDLLLDPQSPLDKQHPDFVFVIPSAERCRHTGSLLDGADSVQSAALAAADELLAACAAFHARRPAEIILANFRLPGEFALGSARSRHAGSDWTFTKLVNLHLGLRAPSYVHLCDLEFLGNRLGHLQSSDPRGWFETRQLASPEFQLLVASECARLVHFARRPSRKVLALDLDDTLWGGVIAEVGATGIDLGDISPIGEAFKAFQRYILKLHERGVLLAIVSKNDLETARQPFRSHPEMVLREEHVSAWRVNWESKADNLKQLSEELGLGLDSFVFVDDNPAEIAVVNQFAPEVETVLLSSDPSEHIRALDERRLFEVTSITAEDMARGERYRSEAGRRASAARITDMDAYLASLEMRMSIRPFCAADAPRIAQLINKSNQFNLTTRRRTQSEVEALIDAPGARAFSVRLADRFGDHGLISVVILSLEEEFAEIDTWLMSCRVLKRQVEDEVLNEIARLTREANRTVVIGRYLPTAKNGLVKDLFAHCGFALIDEETDRFTYRLSVTDFNFRPTHIARADAVD